MKRILILVLLTIAFSPCALSATTQQGTAVKTKASATSEEYLMNKFAQNYVFYFFYETDCPYCRAFAPILKRFVTQYNIKIIPITNDGEGLPEFPNTKANTGESARFHPEGAPMLYALNIHTHRQYLIADGKIDADELKANVLRVARKN